MDDRTCARDKPRLGRFAETVTPTMVENIKVYVNKDRRVTLQEVGNQFSNGGAISHEN